MSYAKQDIEGIANALAHAARRLRREAAKRDALETENGQLKARVAELEARLAFLSDRLDAATSAQDTWQITELLAMAA